MGKAPQGKSASGALRACLARNTSLVPPCAACIEKPHPEEPPQAEFHSPLRGSRQGKIRSPQAAPVGGQGTGENVSLRFTASAFAVNRSAAATPPQGGSELLSSSLDGKNPFKAGSRIPHSSFEKTCKGLFISRLRTNPPTRQYDRGARKSKAPNSRGQKRKRPVADKGARKSKTLSARRGRIAFLYPPDKGG